MILSVTDMLIHYREIVDDSNTALGNKMFEYFIELLQGPCIENQAEICKTKLLETVEDLLIDLTSTKLPSSGKESSENNRELSQYSKSELIKNVINFMLSIVEGSQDQFIFTKVSIHVNQDMFLRRLERIYMMFKNDIEKVNLIGGFGLGVVGNLKSGIFGKGKKSNSSGSLNEDDDKDEEEYKVLVDNKKNYNDIIMEGIYIQILLKTIGYCDGHFKGRLNKLIKEKEHGVQGKEFKKIFNYFSDKVASIEILNTNKDI